ncbi:MAG: hypothetical protein MUF27_11140, partial [Acidobacteria bacterium]|nr:hypothetical protein [Acidobacteriota bacterium]
YAFSLRVTGPHRVVIGLAREVLAVQKTGSGGGTVTSNPAGIDCGGTCSASFPRGQSVTLTAAPAAGSTFGGWSGGGCAGTGPTCSVSLAASAAVTARFDAVTPRYALTVAKSGTGTGTVTSSPAGIDCGADCSESWDAGQQVTLTAAPAGGSSFAGWSGGACAGTNPVCQLTMNAAVSVTAAFQAGAPVSDQTIADLALAGHVTASAAYAALEFAVQGVWEASRQAGQPTFTGTLTEVGTSGAFTYTPTPTDKLVGVFTSGVRVEIRIIRFTGYTGGDWNDFMKDHDVAFEFFSANVVNIRMESLTLPGTVGAYQWTRTYQGELVIRGQAQPIQRRDEGNAKNFSQETDSSFETLEYRTGTVGLAGAVATIDDAAWSLTMNNFAVGRTVRNQRRTSNSSLPAAGGTLKFDGLDVRWETVNTVGDPAPYLGDPGYWYALGGLLQGGAKIGQIQFDGPVSAYTTGPAVIVNLGGGRAVRLWKPIVGPGEQPVPVSWEGLLVRPPE